MAYVFSRPGEFTTLEPDVERALKALEANWKPLHPNGWEKGIKADPAMEGSHYFDFSEVRRRMEDEH